MLEDRTKKTNPTKRATSRENPSSPSSESYPGFIPPHGGYEKLLAYRKSQIIYDATIRFCDRFIDWRSRTHDQMVQAARRSRWAFRHMNPGTKQLWPWM